MSNWFGHDQKIPCSHICTYRNIEGFYPNSVLDDAVNEFAAKNRNEFAKTSGYDDLAVYSNVSAKRNLRMSRTNASLLQQYARGDEGPAAWYGERKLRRLSALKRKWDPHQRFSVSNAVPLSWP